VTTLDLDPRARSPRWRPAPWVVPLFALSGIVLMPWTVFLVRSLPSTHAAAHWDIAWAGFDIGLALLLLGVAVAAWRRSAWLEGTATAAAAGAIVGAAGVIATQVLVDVPTVLIFAAAFGILWRWKISEPLLVGASALVGLALVGLR